MIVGGFISAVSDANTINMTNYIFNRETGEILQDFSGDETLLIATLLAHYRAHTKLASNYTDKQLEERILFDNLTLYLDSIATFRPDRIESSIDTQALPAGLEVEHRSIH